MEQSENRENRKNTENKENIEKMENTENMENVRCTVCFRNCSIPNGQTGFCRARTNENGVIVPSSYGHVTSLALDPIEKKPLAFFHPGSNILSVGSYGCNLACPFCQNHEISMHNLQDQSAVVTPEMLVEKALELIPYGNIGIAFTYNEPLVCYEFVRDTFRLAKEKGLCTVLVTNGTASKNVLDEILPWTDALNIDLKSFDEKTYRWLSGDLESVKRTIEAASKTSHVEITTLLVPGKSDDVKQIVEMAKYLSNINPDIPWHLTRYFPRYKEKEPPTDIEQMKKLKQEASKYMNRVLLGNI